MDNKRDNQLMKNTYLYEVEVEFSFIVFRKTVLTANVPVANEVINEDALDRLSTVSLYTSDNSSFMFVTAVLSYCISLFYSSLSYQ